MRLARVVLIEDDEASQYIYGAVLRHEGFEVLQARTPSAGLELVRTQRPDVVVCDIGLPGMHGFAVTEAIKADAATRHVPVIVVTVHSFEDDQQRAFRAGCDRFLPKPTEPRRLVAEIRSVLADCR